MSEKPISDLRRRMLEDMAVRKLGEKTRHDYIRHVEAFARFLGRSPDTATAEVQGQLTQALAHEPQPEGHFEAPALRTRASGKIGSRGIERDGV